ncbi:cAMP-binding domain of CRP or a regulatory subunit of cAMP-dependent protein kinases [Chitinophaga rupis]|uniref:cAMP-binding domain of CRP or a regulatory subunit of cAMP-dependent protein kinases n=1 Tax=Chitinophaga rupis TaxID=573321 RepID=A0A1H7T3N8_9BACT|nr:Crp/Fnr family transcriptional regulator [Chitinophaga rupis]SEL79165.1 cAMP-binding domain of CRP or a regulatory subunit of cAMP-dependent protein kinases [Chitinophaga rupis]
MDDLILANFAMHITLDPAETEYVRSLLQQKQVKKNSVLLKSGEVCRCVYFVVKGCLRLYHTDEGGKAHIISFSPENWWAVDIASFYSQTPAYYSIAALEDTIVYWFRLDTLEMLYEKIPKFERFFRILTQNGFIIYQRRMTAAQSLRAEERYAQFQRRYPGLEQRIAQKHIASYLGITPVFLSMLRKKLLPATGLPADGLIRDI